MGFKITHGFELHCDADNEPNNLQVNWEDADEKHNPHLLDLTSARCTDSDPNECLECPVEAGFDTYKGEG